MATHTGSHLDAPLHKIAGGKSIDALPLETFVGPARIADLRGLTADAPITAELLAEKLPGLAAGEIVLLATGWGDRRGVAVNEGLGADGREGEEEKEGVAHGDVEGLWRR